MRLQFIFVLCGTVIFLVSSVFAAIAAFYYNIPPYFIFWFMIIASAFVFIITTLFLRGYYETALASIIKAVKGDMTYNSEFEKDENFSLLINEIKEKELQLSKKITLEVSDFDEINHGLESVKNTYETEQIKSKEIRKDIADIKNYITSNIRTFEKIKAPRTLSDS